MCQYQRHAFRVFFHLQCTKINLIHSKSLLVGQVRIHLSTKSLPNVLLSNWDEPEPVESRRLEDATSPYTSCGFDAEYDKKKGSGKIAGFEYDKKTGISAPGFCFTMHVPKAASIWDCLMQSFTQQE